MAGRTLDRDRPLDPVGSIKVKIGMLVALSLVAATLVLQVGTRAGVPVWLTLPVTVAAALGVTQWLARGMTAPLREMTGAAGRMATGDYSVRVTATSADEVGRLGRAFNTMVEDLDTADKQLRQLVATVSHELRTPLAAQRAVLENLVDGVVRPDDGMLKAALAQSERLSALVENLLDASRVDAGAVRLDLAPVRVVELLEGAVAEAGIGGRPVRFETTVTPPDLRVEADAARLAQVVANLLDNASRHSPTDALVRVRAAAEDGDRWSLEVTDEGPGIPSDRAQAVFARFGVADPDGGGTGLGLSIASWVCQLHGGTIAALPTEGRGGARIRAELPRHPNTAPRPSDRPPAAATSTQPAASARAPIATPSVPTPGEITMTTTTPGALPPAAAATGSDGMLGPSVVASMFGNLWPERGRRTAPFALYASVAIGLLAAVVLPYRNLGLGVLLVLLLAGALVLRLSDLRVRAWSILSALLCVGLGLLVVLRAAEWLAVLAVLAAGVLVTTALTDARRPLAMLAGGAAWVLSGLRGLPLLGRTLSATSRQRVLWPVLRTAAISLVALVVFGGLFASGDAVFGSWVSQILPDVAVADSLVLRAFVGFFVGGIVLAGCYLALNPPQVERVGLGEPRPVARSWEWLVPVGVVVGVFAAFLLAQASAMWGGHDFVRRTTGMSYADYVHQGFAQLTLATLLTLVTIGVAVRKAPRGSSRDRMLLRVVLGALCVLTLVVVASALFRMSVYQQAYGYTVLRVLVDAFEVWLGLLVVLVMIAGVRMSGRWLPRAALASGAAFLLFIGLANPEAWVADQNIQRYERTGRIDLGYLSSLGADATPVIQQGLPAELAQCVIRQQPTAGSQDDLLGWNLGRARATDLPGYGSGRSRVGDCPSTIGE